MTEFNAMEWLKAADQRAAEGKASAEETAGQFFASRDAVRKGAGFLDTMQAGLKNRQAVMDPLFELKKAKMQTDILQAASGFQQQILSNKIRQKQLDDEAADDLSAANIIRDYSGDMDKQLEALNTTFWKTPRGIQNATQWRLQIARIKSADAASKAVSKLTPQQLAAVSQYEQGSAEWWNAIEKLQPKEKTYAPTNEEQLIAAEKRLREEGDIANADKISAILTEKGRNKGPAAAKESPEVANARQQLRELQSELNKADAKAATLDDEKEISKLRSYSQQLRLRMQPYQKILSGASKPESKTAAGSTPDANEVIRVTPDGRRAIFNGATKAFIRYAND